METVDGTFFITGVALISVVDLCTETISASSMFQGEMAEWSKATVLGTVLRAWFEPHFRQYVFNTGGRNLFFHILGFYTCDYLESENNSCSEFTLFWDCVARQSNTSSLTHGNLVIRAGFLRYFAYGDANSKDCRVQMERLSRQICRMPRSLSYLFLNDKNMCRGV